MQEKIAKILTRIFGPSVELLVLFFLILFTTGLSWSEIKILLPVTFILELVLPIGTMLYLLYTKKITDFDITDRKQRPMFFGMVLTFYFISLVVIYFYGNDLFFQIKALVFGAMVVGTIITAKWKISVHLAANTLTIILFSFLLSYYFVFLIVLLPVVAWTRHVLKKHTPAQMLAGVILSSLIILPLLYIL